MTRWWLAFLVSGCVGIVDEAPRRPSVAPEPSTPAAPAAPTDAGTEVFDAGAAPGVDAGPAAPSSDGGRDAGVEPSDGGGFFGASRCDGSFTVCDGFEGAALDPALWEYYPPPAGSTAFARQDATQAARGAQALHLRSGIQLRAKEPMPWLANGFHLRVFMRWAQSVPDWHRTYLFVAAPGESFALGSYHDQFAITVYGPNNGDTGVAARDPLPINRWVCVEWQVNPANQEVHLWMDGRDVPAEAQNPFGVPNLHVSNWPPMHWNQLYLEFITANPDDELWMDELALSSARIGCDR